jgi:alpha-ketoglutarate-dependent taurine dioxygenase
MDPEVMAGIVAIMHDEEVAFAWQPKDAIYIDNRAVMHSRRTFEPPRRILASIAASFAHGAK